MSSSTASSIYATSTMIDPPAWVRVPLMALCPVGPLVSLPLGAIALQGRGRGMGIAGWAASAAGLALFAYAIAALS